MAIQKKKPPRRRRDDHIVVGVTAEPRQVVQARTTSGFADLVACSSRASSAIL
jgi:hypothetical protein